MNPTTQKKYGQPSIGCYLSHGNYNNEELSKAICDVAVSHGWQPFEADQLLLDACFEVVETVPLVEADLAELNLSS